MDEIFADRMPPAPLTAFSVDDRVILIEEMIHPFVIDDTVGVVDPAFGAGEMIDWHVWIVLDHPMS